MSCDRYNFDWSWCMVLGPQSFTCARIFLRLEQPIQFDFLRAAEAAEPSAASARTTGRWPASAEAAEPWPAWMVLDAKHKSPSQHPPHEEPASRALTEKLLLLVIDQPLPGTGDEDTAKQRKQREWPLSAAMARAAARVTVS